MRLVETDASGIPMGMGGPVFHVIGTDGGLLPAPVMTSDLLQAPAERFDVIVDFTGRDGQFFVLKNDAPAPFPGGGEVVPTEIMMFRVVKRLSSRDTSTIPAVLNPVPMNIDPGTAVKSRNLTLIGCERAKRHARERLKAMVLQDSDRSWLAGVVRTARDIPDLARFTSRSNPRWIQ
jgi:spore coat protein A